MTPEHQASEPPQSLVPHLHTILQDLRKEQYPDLPSPEGLKKRASVAFILRVNPSYAHWPESQTQKHEDPDSYFSEDWVQHGEPEVLFIKRASRKGDRWTSHIALPGGKRDPTDADDKAAAIREAWEEVGIDLDTCAVECGNLPQRLVTTHWGKKPLLVLCPYVFLVTQHAIPPLKLQPSEVASTHWVPLRSLLSPAQRSLAHEDVSSRIAGQEKGLRQWLLGLLLGKMTFAAIALVPTESLRSLESPSSSSSSSSSSESSNHALLPPKRQEAPLLLWGLTLGITLDFLDLLPPHTALHLWTYPTFTTRRSPDIRFLIWLLTHNFKDRKRAELQSGVEVKSTRLKDKDQDLRLSFGGASESGVESRRRERGEGDDGAVGGGGGGGGGVNEEKKGKAAVQIMLEGWVETFAKLVLPEINDRGRYYDIVRRAVALALVGRVTFAMVVVVLIWRRRGLGGSRAWKFLRR